MDLPENLQSAENAGFVVMKKFMSDMFGDQYIDKLIRVAKPEFARLAILSWSPNDANTIIDISPMPPPWQGDWGYRIRFCAILSDGNVHVMTFYVPASTVPAFKRGDYSSLN